MAKSAKRTASRILTIEEIKAHVAAIAPQYDVKRVSLFGSYANGNPTANSDIDLLVEFRDDSRVTLFTIAGMKVGLEDLTSRVVDVIAKPISTDSILKINREVPLYG